MDEEIKIPVTDGEKNETKAAEPEKAPAEEIVLEPEIVSDEEIAAEEAAVEAEANTEDVEAEANTEDKKVEANTEDVKSDANTEDKTVEKTDDDKSDDSDAPKETDWRDSYIRLAADFDNYRKRTNKEQDDIRRRERERVICTWLEVYDNAERALASMPEKEGPWYEGFSSLIKQMEKCLLTYNIKPADDMGKPFDPKRHEAIATCPNPAMENNTIMHVERRGFVYENGNVVRVARVIVVKNPS